MKASYNVMDFKLKNRLRAGLLGLSVLTIALLLKEFVRSSLSPTTNAVHGSTRGEGCLDPLVIKGYKFFNSRTGEHVLIKGIDYYPRPNAGFLNRNNVDLYTLEYRHIWERDIAVFQDLGVNAIRLYSVDPDKDHSAFMWSLNQAGIYVLVELASGSCPNCAISEKKTPLCYPRQLKRRGEAIISEFSSYSNTLIFSTGNEVNHYIPEGEGQWWNAPCLKKFLRDMRAFVKSCGSMRQVPIGLIAADSGRDENAAYYNCEADHVDDLEYAQWFGLNTYVYCDGNASTFDEATGFNSLERSFQDYNYSIPVLLTEYGCLSKSFPTIDGYEGQRTFNQARWFSLEQVQNQFAGGFAFEYSLEAANAQTAFPFKAFDSAGYGIGHFAPDDCDDITVMCTYEKTPSFYALKSAYANVTTDLSISLESFTPPKNRTKRSKCPKHFPDIHSFHWQADWEPSRKCPHSTTTCDYAAGAATSSSSGMKTLVKIYIAALGGILMYMLSRIMPSVKKTGKDANPSSAELDLLHGGGKQCENYQSC